MKARFLRNLKLLPRVALWSIILWADLFAPKPIIYRTLTPDPELEVYRKDFEAEFKVKVDIPIGFVRDFSDERGMSPFTVGIHYRRAIGNRIEILDIKRHKTDLKYLVYHELGHELGMKHTQTGIMSPDMNYKEVSEFYFAPRRLIEEMKTQGKAQNLKAFLTNN